MRMKEDHCCSNETEEVQTPQHGMVEKPLI